jgi:hypothetical protein
MKIDSSSNYLKGWDLYEVARYVPSLNRVLREKNLLVKSNEIQKYAIRHKSIGIYTSVFAYDTEDLEKATRLRSTLF